MLPVCLWPQVRLRVCQPLPLRESGVSRHWWMMGGGVHRIVLSNELVSHQLFLFFLPGHRPIGTLADWLRPRLIVDRKGWMWFWQSTESTLYRQRALHADHSASTIQQPTASHWGIRAPKSAATCRGVHLCLIISLPCACPWSRQ